MSRKSNLKIAAMIALGLTTLTACDPPMPPDVLAALAEQSYTCVEGNTEIALPAEIIDLSADWEFSVSDSCPGMTLSSTDLATSSTELVVSPTGKFDSQPYASVPFALDAAVFTYSIDGISNLNLSGEVIAGIVDGTITTWADPKIGAINPGNSFSDVKINLICNANQLAIKSLEAVVNRLAKRDTDFSKLTPVDQPESIELNEGDLVLTTFSKATFDGISVASLLLGDDPSAGIVAPDAASITAASTQWKVTKTENSVTVELDPNAKVIITDGSDVAPLAYQAIYPVTLGLVGTDSLKTRAMARYLLRLDSQGALAGSYMLNIPEHVRSESLQVVSVGLPKPTPLPTE